MAKTVILENGVAVECGDYGRIRSLGRDFVSVAANGQGMVAGVTKDGVAIIYKDGLQKFQISKNAVSVQISGDHIFVLQDNGVTVEYDSQGIPIRNHGAYKPKHRTNKVEEQSSTSHSNDKEPSPKVDQQTDWSEVTYGYLNRPTHRRQDTFEEIVRYKIECEWEALFKYPLWESNIGKGLLVVGGIGLFLFWVSQIR